MAPINSNDLWMNDCRLLATTVMAWVLQAVGAFASGAH